MQSQASAVTYEQNDIAVSFAMRGVHDKHEWALLLGTDSDMLNCALNTPDLEHDDRHDIKIKVKQQQGRLGVGWGKGSLRPPAHLSADREGLYISVHASAGQLSSGILYDDQSDF